MEGVETGRNIYILGARGEQRLVNEDRAKYGRTIILSPTNFVPGLFLIYFIELWDALWPVSILTCKMDRPIVEWLMKSGDWEVVELKTEGDPWHLRPRAWGRLRKVARDH